jgi:signal peptidase I
MPVSETKDSKEKNGSAPVGYRGIYKQSKKEETSADFSRSFSSFLLEVLKVVIVSLAIIIPVRYFVIQPFYVRGASMEPNFHDNEYLIINEITYRFSEPQRGDIVVLRNPNNRSDFFIKRVIGLPDERIEVSRGEVTVYNDEFSSGFILDESDYLDPTVYTGGNDVTELGPEEYFVMGDNRNSSLDSRSFGAIPRSDIVGKAWLRAWPPQKMTLFVAPEYNQ